MYLVVVFLDHITKLQKVINIWKMRNPSLFEKQTFYKTLALSKIIHQALVTNEATAKIELLSKMQKEFLWGKISLRLNMKMIMKMED